MTTSHNENTDPHPPSEFRAFLITLAFSALVPLVFVGPVFLTPQFAVTDGWPWFVMLAMFIPVFFMVAMAGTARDENVEE